MPIYEYQCEKCGHQLEAFQKMTEAALTNCPECHGATLQKLVSAGGFQLKGTGWYATDFRDKGKKPPETKKETSPENKSETKTESKKVESTTGASADTKKSGESA